MEGTLLSFTIILEKLEEGILLSTRQSATSSGWEFRVGGLGKAVGTDLGMAFPLSPSPSSLVTRDGRRECHLFNLQVSKLGLREGKGFAQGDTEGW